MARYSPKPLAAQTVLRNSPHFRYCPEKQNLREIMQEIQAAAWPAFCERLNQFQRGATVDIHWIDRATKVQREIARAAEFHEITFGRRDACNDQIVVRAGDEAGNKTHHEIVEPIHILLRDAVDGSAHNAVAVEAEEGITILTFRPVIRHEWLEGVLSVGS